MNPLKFHHIANEHSTLGLHFISNIIESSISSKTNGGIPKIHQKILSFECRCASDLHPMCIHSEMCIRFSHIIRSAKWSNASSVSMAFPKGINQLPSGKQPHNYGKSPFLMGKLTINGHFQSLFVCLQGRVTLQTKDEVITGGSSHEKNGGRTPRRPLMLPRDDPPVTRSGDKMIDATSTDLALAGKSEKKLVQSS